MVQTNNSVTQLLGYNVKRLREGKGWSREDLANRIEMTPQSVSSIELGTRFVTAESMASLSNVFGVPLSRLLATTLESTSEQLKTLPDRDQRVVWALVKVLGEVK